MLLNLSTLSFCLKATILQTLRTTLVRVWKHAHTQKFDLTKKSSLLMCVVFLFDRNVLTLLITVTLSPQQLIKVFEVLGGV